MVAQESGVSPKHILGVLYAFSSGGVELLKTQAHAADTRVAFEAACAFLEDRESELEGYEPVASCGGFVALSRRPSPPAVVLPGLSLPPSDLVVCNPVTGQHVSLPRPSIWDESFVLLAHGTSFSLQIVNLELADAGMLQIQTFSSAKGKWDGVVATYANLPLGAPGRFIRPSPLLLDGVAYWLCKSESKSLGYHVLTLPLDGQRQPAPIKLPDKVPKTRGRGDNFDAEDILLASTTVNGTRRLTLAAVANVTISLWTLDEHQAEKPARWTRHKFFDLWNITLERKGRLPSWEKGDRVALECFSESGESGSLLFHFYHRMLYRIDLQTEKQTEEVSLNLAGIYCKRSSSNMCEYHIDDAAVLKLKS
ncbi:hypothetical protein CFC21_080066 [Triticum aestivum]|uniref:DUF7595 domain-containing protein n=2 Tax=Triticum aestivum TaxID=4565 RepID=A0A9R1I1D1_WHEAT|nr:hypothetical protein CFC21_080066 [Triticum aestivum]